MSTYPYNFQTFAPVVSNHAVVYKTLGVSSNLSDFHNLLRIMRQYHRSAQIYQSIYTNDLGHLQLFLSSTIIKKNTIFSIHYNTWIRV